QGVCPLAQCVRNVVARRYLSERELRRRARAIRFGLRDTTAISIEDGQSDADAEGRQNTRLTIGIMILETKVDRRLRPDRAMLYSCRKRRGFEREVGRRLRNRRLRGGDL